MLEGYEFIEDNELPCLVLAIVQDPQYPRQFKFKPNHQWRPIQHQTAGYGCHQVYLDAMILKPRDFAAVNKLAKTYDDSCLNMFSLSLDQILDYRENLEGLLGVGCNDSFSHLEEGIYPIDANPENIKKLCKDRLPKDLDNLIEWEHGFERARGFIGRWRLFILGSNCD